MKIIITGATGFLGRNIAETFHLDGWEVRATGRSIVVGNELRKRGIQFERADLLDSSKRQSAVHMKVSSKGFQISIPERWLVKTSGPAGGSLQSLRPS